LGTGGAGGRDCPFRKDTATSAANTTTKRATA